MTRQLLGRSLIDAGMINEDQLRIALVEQQKRRQPLGILLHTLGFAGEKGISDVLADQLGYTRFDPLQHPVDAAAVRLIPAEIARRHRLLPVSLDPQGRRWQLAMAAPGDGQALDNVRAHTPAGLKTEILLASQAEIEQAIDLHYGYELAIDGIIDEFEGKSPSAPHGGDSPAVRLVDALLADAVRRQASDIHFEPENAGLRIRYRVDGILETVRILHKSTWPGLAGRIKILAGMNIAETRSPQDGHLSQQVAGRHIDFRAASQPTIHGENIVLRILDRQKGIVPLASLGLEPAQQALLERMSDRPEGLLLVTGPTGSGKTTTLYSLLNRLNHDGVHIMTLEDPVEYPLPLLRQTSLSESVKLDFASGVRSMLRQDPDIILIGEIRDAETAAMALRAALTGHRVFATLHAGSALAAFSRLRELGIETQRLHGNLTGIVAQRLVRRLCRDCRSSRPATAAESTLLGDERVAVAVGCPHCRGHGYRGRLALLETLSIDPELDLLLAGGATPPTLHAAAVARGFNSLRDNALQRVRNGDTTLDEAARAVDIGNWH